MRRPRRSLLAPISLSIGLILPATLASPSLATESPLPLAGEPATSSPPLWTDTGSADEDEDGELRSLLIPALPPQDPLPGSGSPDEPAPSLPPQAPDPDEPAPSLPPQAPDPLGPNEFVHPCNRAIVPTCSLQESTYVDLGLELGPGPRARVPVRLVQNQVRAQAMNEMRAMRTRMWAANPPYNGRPLRTVLAEHGITSAQAFANQPQWDNDAERISIQRAAEQSISGITHDRPSGHSIFALGVSGGQGLGSENLACAEGFMTSAQGMSQFEAELADLIRHNGSFNTATGHLHTLLNPTKVRHAFSLTDQTHFTNHSVRAQGNTSPAPVGDGCYSFDVPLPSGTAVKLSDPGVLGVGDTATLLPTGVFNKRELVMVGTFSSSAPDVVQVDQQTGEMRAKAPGSAVITFRTAGADSVHTRTITVSAGTVPTLKLAGRRALLPGLDDVAVVSATVNGAETQVTGRFSTDAPEIIAVDPVSGVYRGLTPGKARVIFTAVPSGRVTSMEVRVEQVKRYSWTWSASNAGSSGTLVVRLASANLNEVVPGKFVVAPESFGKATIDLDTGSFHLNNTGKVWFEYSVPGTDIFKRIAIDVQPGLELTGPNVVKVGQSIKLKRALNQGPGYEVGELTSLTPQLLEVHNTDQVRGLAPGSGRVRLSYSSWWVDFDIRVEPGPGGNPVLPTPSNGPATPSAQPSVSVSPTTSPSNPSVPSAPSTPSATPSASPKPPAPTDAPANPSTAPTASPKPPAPTGAPATPSTTPTASAPATPTPPTVTSRVVRLAGNNRVDTAIAVAQAQAPASTAILATGNSYADALSAAGLSRVLDAPIYLTASSSGLESQVVASMRRQGVRHVVILGGHGSVPLAVERTVLNSGMTVERIAGASRTDTSLRVAQRAISVNGAAVKRVFVTDGTNFPDGLAAGAASANAQAITVLTNGSSLPAATAAFLREQSRFRAVDVLGGKANTALQQASVQPAKRFLGASRYETAYRVAKAFASPAAPNRAIRVVIANGNHFADALAASALTAREGGVLLLSTASTLEGYAASYLMQLSGPVHAYLAGGENSLSTRVENSVRLAVD
ncbi:cell wall-binding repeat-containing protein [Buchananella felis]|uniref:cell wall-binding repeat-containing protein n=1 Tax=Buchananella felis TaxID=3231492 RepID=UPI0035276C5F